MTNPYTKVNLAVVEDAAPANGLGDRWEARVAREALRARQTSVTHVRLPPGGRSPFSHRHTEAEEVYVILRGSGRGRLDGRFVEVAPLDALRVDAPVARAFEAATAALSSWPSGATCPGTDSRSTTRGSNSPERRAWATGRPSYWKSHTNTPAGECVRHSTRHSPAISRPRPAWLSGVRFPPAPRAAPRSTRRSAAS
jgi:mannose-6-phosphate isomerase-like protein (cupin superfamily)